MNIVTEALCQKQVIHEFTSHISKLNHRIKQVEKSIEKKQRKLLEMRRNLLESTLAKVKAEQKLSALVDFGAGTLSPPAHSVLDFIDGWEVLTWWDGYYYREDMVHQREFTRLVFRPSDAWIINA